MKANELSSRDLMVGDWLMFYDKPCQVKGLHDDDTVTLTGYRSMYNLIDAEPILLTPEILEKNADFYRDEKYYNYYDFSKEIDIYHNSISVEICESKGTVYWTINGNEYGITKLKYVHELQHALKLCGIDKEIKL